MKTKKNNIRTKAISVGMAAMMTGSMVTPTFAASYKWPLGSYRGQIVGKFGEHGHMGTDISGYRIDRRKIYSVASGKVISAGFAGGYGRYVRVKNNDGKIVTYAHMSKMVTAKGRKVKRGTYIGKVGMTGNASAPHLHIDMQKKKWKGKKAKYVYVNPMKYLKQPR